MARALRQSEPWWCCPCDVTVSHRADTWDRWRKPTEGRAGCPRERAQQTQRHAERWEQILDTQKHVCHVESSADGNGSG